MRATVTAGFVFIMLYCLSTIFIWLLQTVLAKINREANSNAAQRMGGGTADRALGGMLVSWYDLTETCDGGRPESLSSAPRRDGVELER
jgi:hypothetical protein